MLIVMNASATDAEIKNAIRVVESLGFRAHTMPGATRTAIGVTDNQGAVDLSHFENMPGVAEAIRVTKIDRPLVASHADRKSTRLNSSHRCISYAVFCLKKKKHKLS